MSQPSVPAQPRAPRAPRRRTLGLSTFALGALVVLLITTLIAAPADAQRRRRRPRRPVAPAEQVEAVPADAGVPEPPAPAPAPTPQPATTGPTPPVAPGAQPAQPVTPGAAMQTSGNEPPPAGGGENAPVPAFDPGPAPPDVSPIRNDYVRLMDDLVQARSRVSALGAELFRTRVLIVLADRTRGSQAMARFVVHLDGAPVFQSDGPVEGADDQRELFTGAVAPGPHVLTLEIEQRARDDDNYRYTLRESYRFEVTRERLSEVTLILEDGSDIARAFRAGGEGRYDVRTRMRVATRLLPAQ